MIHTPDHPGMIPVDDGKSKDLGDLNIIGSGASVMAMGKHGPGSWGRSNHIHIPFVSSLMTLQIRVKSE
jgi:hypothetical protein